MIRSYMALIRNERPALLFGIGCVFLSSPGQTFFISLFVGAVAIGLLLDAGSPIGGLPQAVKPPVDRPPAAGGAARKPAPTGRRSQEFRGRQKATPSNPRKIRPCRA